VVSRPPVEFLQQAQVIPSLEGGRPDETQFLGPERARHGNADAPYPGAVLHPCAEPIDLYGWRFKDEEDTHTFWFPEQTVVAPGGYLVLVRDLAAFQALFPEVTNVVGEMDFGLSGDDPAESAVTGRAELSRFVKK